MSKNEMLFRMNYHEILVFIKAPGNEFDAPYTMKYRNGMNQTWNLSFLQ